MTLKYKAENMFDKMRETINLVVKQSMNLDSIVNMDNDTIEGLRSVNELINETQEYYVEQAKAMEGMGDQLDRLQRQMAEMNSNMNVLLAKVNMMKEEQA